MTLGNVWLGSMQVSSVSAAAAMSQSSFTMSSTVSTSPSVLDRVTVHIAGACTELIKIAIIPVAGTTYSTLVLNTSTSGHTDYFYQPDRPLFMYPGDECTVTVTNTGLTANVYGNMILLA